MHEVSEELKALILDTAASLETEEAQTLYWWQRHRAVQLFEKGGEKNVIDRLEFVLYGFSMISSCCGCDLRSTYLDEIRNGLANMIPDSCSSAIKGEHFVSRQFLLLDFLFTSADIVRENCARILINNSHELDAPATADLDILLKWTTICMLKICLIASRPVLESDAANEEFRVQQTHTVNFLVDTWLRNYLGILFGSSSLYSPENLRYHM